MSGLAGPPTNHDHSTRVTSPSPVRPSEPPDPSIRRTWWILSGAFLVLGALVIVQLAVSGGGIAAWAFGAIIVVAAVAAVLHRNAVAGLEQRRRAEAESFNRILIGLSRSVSPDAIVAAIVDELAGATSADHIVVVRRRPEAPILEATLVSRRAGVADSTTRIPVGDLDDPIDGRTRSRPLAEQRFRDAEHRIADRIAGRVRDVFGLSDTLAAPLRAGDRLVGAIVVSRRAGGGWSESGRRLLDGAAEEASAALGRAYSQRRAETEAATDALTGLPNRRYFDEYSGLLARRRRAGDAVGVLMVDIDRFKLLNDRHGHATGDEVLRAVAGAIVATVREEDVPARIGGEEFAVLLRNPSPTVAVEIGERVREAVRALDLRAHGVDGVTVSIGVAVSGAPDGPIADLVAEADGALYRAKRGGRDRVVAA